MNESIIVLIARKRYTHPAFAFRIGGYLFVRGEDQEEYFKTMVMQAEDGIVRLGADFAIRFINPSMLRMLGLENEDECIGKKFTDLVEASDHGKVEKEFERRKEGISGCYVITFLRKDGTSFIGALSSAPLLEGDVFRGSFATIKDMTSYERILDRLRSSEARYRKLAKQLPAAICEIDSDSSIRYKNDFAHRLLGIGEEDRRAALRSYVAEDELPRYDRIVAEAFGGRESGPFPMDLLLRCGERLPALWNMAMVSARKGSPRVSVVIIEVKSVISAAFTYDGNFFSPYGLTERERAVALRLIAGSIYKEIAFELDISLSTVRTHTMSLYRKMGIHSREELVDLGMRWQIGRYGRNIFVERLWRGTPPHTSAK
jgi:PAS domain S-box-containing protein